MADWRNIIVLVAFVLSCVAARYLDEESFVKRNSNAARDTPGIRTFYI
jgi:hypothetical protein